MFDYSELTLNHFYHPRNIGTFACDDDCVYTGVAGSVEEGRCIQLQIKCSQGRIEKAVFKALGPVSCIAVASWLTEKLIGLTLAEATGISGIEMANSLQLPQQETYCAFLAEDALKAALLSHSR